MPHSADQSGRLASHGYGASMSGFCNILAYRITVSSLRGFLAVTMTAGIVTLAGGAFRRAVRGGLAYTMRGGLSLGMVIQGR